MAYGLKAGQDWLGRIKECLPDCVVCLGKHTDLDQSLLRGLYRRNLHGNGALALEPDWNSARIGSVDDWSGDWPWFDDDWSYWWKTEVHQSPNGATSSTDVAQDSANTECFSCDCRADCQRSKAWIDDESVYWGLLVAT